MEYKQDRVADLIRHTTHAWIEKNKNRLEIPHYNRNATSLQSKWTLSTIYQTDPEVEFLFSSYSVIVQVIESEKILRN